MATVEEWFLEAGRRGNKELFERYSVLQDGKNCGDGWWRGLHNHVDVLNAAEQ